MAWIESGGFKIDLNWRDRRLVEAIVRASVDGPCVIRAEGPVEIRVDGQVVRWKCIELVRIKFEAESAKDYKVRLFGS